MIVPEGIGPTKDLPRDVFQGEVLEKKVSSAVSLTDLAEDFAFFTTALFYTHAGLRNDPVQEFINEFPGRPALSIMRFERPIFRGLSAFGSGSWAGTLLLIEKSAWDLCFRFLTQVGIQDTPRKIFYRSLPHDVTIADPLFLSRQSVLPEKIPMVTVTVFGLDGNRRKVFVQSAIRPPFDLPMVRIGKPERQTVDYGIKLFRGENPLA